MITQKTFHYYTNTNMSKHWKIKIKKNKMENIKNEEIEKKIMLEKVEPEEKGEKTEPQIFQVKKYKMKFNKITGYRLAEESTIHCANGDKLIGHEGDFYVCLDSIQEFILPTEIFKKLFIMDLEKND